MEKAKIKLVTLGHLPLHLDLKRISSWKSDVFDLVVGIENFALRCDSDIDDWTFSDAILKSQLPVNLGGDFLIAIVNIPIEDNWYARRLGNNKIVFTLHEIRDFLAKENIPIENAILRALYAYTLLYRRSGNKIPGFDESINFTHDETRGCLFDMNGIKPDLIESCNKPIVCTECEERLRNERVSTQTIKIVQKEIRSIRKRLYYRALDFIKAKPLFALVISSAFAIFLGIIGSIIASYIYEVIKP